MGGTVPAGQQCQPTHSRLMETWHAEEHRETKRMIEREGERECVCVRERERKRGCEGDGGSEGDREKKGKENMHRGRDERR